MKFIAYQSGLDLFLIIPLKHRLKFNQIERNSVGCFRNFFCNFIKKLKPRPLGVVIV